MLIFHLFRCKVNRISNRCASKSSNVGYWFQYYGALAVSTIPGWHAYRTGCWAGHIKWSTTSTNIKHLNIILQCGWMVWHHSGLSDTGYLCLGRGRGGWDRGGKWGGRITKTMGKVKCSCDVGRMHSEPQTATPPGAPIPSRNMGRNGSPQQTENAIEWRILPEGRVLFASNPEKDNAQKSFCYLHISLCRKKIMLRAPSCSTWNCDADSSSGNCLAAWQDWQNRGGRGSI